MDNFPRQKQHSQQSLQLPSSQSNAKDQFLGKVLFQKYLLTKKLGEGSFGKIYKATTKTESFAFKIEKKRIHHSLLENEFYIMNRFQGYKPGIPRIDSFCYGSEYNIMIMQLLGKSLEYHLHHLPHKAMTLKTVCNIAIQIISILEIIHNNHYIHRDIKPDNFVVGLGNHANTLYIIDFGLAKMYRDPHTLIHNEMVMRKKLIGTARYASIHALQGMEQSRRDDIESVAYLVLYLINGSLPWQGIVLKNKEDKYAKILEKKSSLTDEELCKGLPKQFYHFVTYARNLEYKENPKYDYMKSLFVECLNERKLNYDKVYDWNEFVRAKSVKIKDTKHEIEKDLHNEEDNFEYYYNDNNYNNIYGNPNEIAHKRTENYSSQAHLRKHREILSKHSFSFSNNINNNQFILNPLNNGTKTIINNYILKQSDSSNSLKHKFNYSGEVEFNGESGYYNSL